MVNPGSDRMTVPEVREALFAVAVQLEELQHYAQANEIKRLVGQLTRRPVIQKAVIKSRPATATMHQMIRDYAKDNPDMSQVEIAAHFFVNQGRVSEALRGKR